MIKTILSVTVLAVVLAGCSNAPSNSNLSNIGVPEKNSLPTPIPPGYDNRSANANNPQRNATGESQATNTAANANIR